MKCEKTRADPTCGPPNWKIPEPSRKKGRFSGRNVSTAERLMIAGSTSTWPKSGFMVPVTESADPSPTRKSTPAAPFSCWRFANGSPDDIGCLATLELKYGVASTGDGGLSPTSPLRIPIADTKPGMEGVYGDQKVHSSRRATAR